MKKYLHIFGLLLLTLLGMVGCSNLNIFKNNSIHIINFENNLLVSDAHNIAILNLTNNESQLISNKIFLQSLNYDKNLKQVVAPGYSPDSNFSGLIYLENNKITKADLKQPGFAPIQLYQYRNMYIMNSAQVLKEGLLDNTELVFYDTSKNQIVKKIRIPGIVKDVSGNGSKAYVSSYQFPDESKYGVSKKSNIYEFDLETLQYRKILPQDQDYVPFRIEYHDGYLYGVYQDIINTPKDAPQNKLVKIDLKTGEILKSIQLSDNSRDLIFTQDGKYAIVTHFYALFNRDILIKDPLTIVDLQTYESKELAGDYRAASIINQNGKIYIGDDLNKKITVLDEKSLKQDKVISMDIAPLYLANETKSGKQHGQ